MIDTLRRVEAIPSIGHAGPRRQRHVQRHPGPRRRHHRRPPGHRNRLDRRDFSRGTPIVVADHPAVFDRIVAKPLMPSWS